MGLVSHKNQLWIFKGPYHGSIHRITGSSPTGSDSFARKDFVRGLGAAGHNSIFPFKDDIGFIWSDGTIHSLKATAAFGDFQEVSLSFPINKFLRDRVNHDRLDRAWTAIDVSRGIVMMALPIDGSSFPNFIAAMDHRFDPIRWSPIFAFDVTSIANIIDSTNNNRPTLMIGGSDGFVRIMDQVDRSVDGTGVISAKVTLPFLNYGIPLLRKTLAYASLSLEPKGDYGATLGWQRDTNTQQTETVLQGGGDVLGPSNSNPFTLGTSALSGATFIERSIDLAEGGEFGAVQYQVTQDGTNEELRLRAITTTLEIGTMSLEE